MESFSDKDRLSIAVAKLYYESNRSQQEIASELNISRPTVSRLLQRAKDAGFVQITILDPDETVDVLERHLKEKYHLNHVVIANTPIDDKNEIKKSIGSKAAEYLGEVVKDGDIIGTGWGSTLYEMAQQLQSKIVKNVQVVQLKGGISYSQSNTYANEIVSLIEKAFSAKGMYLPIPVMFDTVEVKQIVETDKFVKNVLNMGKESNVAIFTVGPASEESLLFHLGYYINDLDRQILSQNAVGDLCSRFYDAEGQIVDPKMDERTVGIRLEELKAKERRILCAGGKDKVVAIHYALLHKFANVLITDRFTAMMLLKFDYND